MDIGRSHRAAKPGSHDRALGNAEIFIRNDQLRINGMNKTQSGTIFAGAHRIIERKHPGGQFLDTDVVFRTGITQRKGLLFLISGV